MFFLLYINITHQWVILQPVINKIEDQLTILSSNCLGFKRDFWKESSTSFWIAMLCPFLVSCLTFSFFCSFFLPSCVLLNPKPGIEILSIFFSSLAFTYLWISSTNCLLVYPFIVCSGDFWVWRKSRSDGESETPLFLENTVCCVWFKESRRSGVRDLCSFASESSESWLEKSTDFSS